MRLRSPVGDIVAAQRRLQLRRRVPGANAAWHRPRRHRPAGASASAACTGRPRTAVTTSSLIPSSRFSRVRLPRRRTGDSACDFRRARGCDPVASQRARCWFVVPPDPALREGASALYAQWRDRRPRPHASLRSGPEPRRMRHPVGRSPPIPRQRRFRRTLSAPATSLVRADLL